MFILDNAVAQAAEAKDILIKAAECKLMRSMKDDHFNLEMGDWLLLQTYALDFEKSDEVEKALALFNEALGTKSSLDELSITKEIFDDYVGVKDYDKVYWDFNSCGEELDEDGMRIVFRKCEDMQYVCDIVEPHSEIPKPVKDTLKLQLIEFVKSPIYMAARACYAKMTGT